MAPAYFGLSSILIASTKSRNTCRMPWVDGIVEKCKPTHPSRSLGRALMMCYWRQSVRRVGPVQVSGHTDADREGGSIVSTETESCDPSTNSTEITPGPFPNRG